MGGNKLGARFVCALDYFTRIDARSVTADVIVRSFCIAKKIDPETLLETMRDPKTRLDAQFLYDDASVQSLVERLNHRSRALAIERVSMRTYETVEKLYSKADEEHLDGEYQLDLRKAALNASVSLLSIEERRQSGESKRRDNRAYRQSLDMSRASMRDESLPPTMDEARGTILMLRALFGEAWLREQLTAALPMVDAGAPETIDANEHPA